MGWVFSDEMRFYLHDNETVLEGLIRTQHQQVRYECRQGYCGMCRMKVLAKTGDVIHKITPIAMLEDDEILACCCQATGTLRVSYAQSACEQQVAFTDDFFANAGNKKGGV